MDQRRFALPAGGELAQRLEAIDGVDHWTQLYERLDGAFLNPWEVAEAIYLSVVELEAPVRAGVASQAPAIIEAIIDDSDRQEATLEEWRKFDQLVSG